MNFITRRYVEWNWRWNIDSALRYESAISIIGKRKRASIVEVGCGSRGISAYANRPSIGVDLSFNETVPPRLQQRVLASGVHLPFKDRSVDLVISTDMLEHVACSIRPLIIKEMFRIVHENGAVYITVPVGQESEQADKRVDNAFKARHGVSHPMLRDHLEHGLPRPKEIVDMVQEELRDLGWKVKVVENTPIALWEGTLMLFGVGRWLPGLRHFQRPILQTLYPILKRIRGKRNYRIIVTAEKMIDY